MSLGTSVADDPRLDGCTDHLCEGHRDDPSLQLHPGAGRPRAPRR